MGYRDHIVAKLSALAVAGGTTAMLFAASPVHTAFNATTNGSLSASGATVSETLTKGTLDASGLLPGVPTNPKIVYITNSGSVPEDFSLMFNSPTNMTLPSWSAFNQLEYKDTAYSCTTLESDPAVAATTTPRGCNFIYAAPSFTPLFSTAITGSSSFPTSNVALNIGGPLAPGSTLEVSISLELMETPGTGDGSANAWNGASVKIPYTITAEPAASAPAPTLSASS